MLYLTSRLEHTRQVVADLQGEISFLESVLNRQPACSALKQLNRLKRLEQLKPQLRRWREELRRIQAKSGARIKIAHSEEPISPAGYALY